MKMKQFIKTNFRILVDWLILTVITHLFVSKIVYPISIRSMFFQMANIDFLYARATAVLFLFDLVCLLYLCFFDTYIQNKKNPYYDDLKEEMRAESFSPKAYFSDKYKVINFFKLIIFMIIQLPYTIFYAVFGFDFRISLAIESFYKMESGVYLITKFWIFGMVLVAVIIIFGLFLSQYLAFKRAFAGILKNSPDEFYKHLR